LLIVGRIGLGFALARRHVEPRAFGCAVWGFWILIAAALLRVVLRVIVVYEQFRIMSDGVGVADLPESLNYLALAATPLLAVGIALLARALVVDRALAATPSA
jgi:hypothetical protein